VRLVQGGSGVHAGFWEKVADTLFWLQLLWVFSGFVLMAYLAFKVFPDPSKPDPDFRSAWSGPGFNDGKIMSPNPESARFSDGWMVAGNYRLESFPQPAAPAKIIQFRTTISEQNRRMS
jgi:hypothetical protein